MSTCRAPTASTRPCSSRSARRCPRCRRQPAPQARRRGRARRLGRRRAARATSRSCCRPCRRRPRSLKAHRTHGHLAAHLDPLGRAAGGGPVAGSGAPAPDAGADGADPGLDPARLRARGERSPRRCRDCARPTAGRSPTRSSTSAPTASACGCGRRSRPALPHAAERRGTEAAAQAPDRGRRAGALHAQGLPRAEAVLGRGSRHDRADDRRGHPARRLRTARARS